MDPREVRRKGRTLEEPGLPMEEVRRNLEVAGVDRLAAVAAVEECWGSCPEVEGHQLGNLRTGVLRVGCSPSSEGIGYPERRTSDCDHLEQDIRAVHTARKK